MGEWKDGGWWYDDIHGLAVKPPHGSQFLLAMAVLTVFCFRPKSGTDPLEGKIQERVRPPFRRGFQRLATWRDVVILLAPAVVGLIW